MVEKYILIYVYQYIHFFDKIQLNIDSYGKIADESIEIIVFICI